MLAYMTDYLKEQGTRINKKEKKSGSVYRNKSHFPYIMWSTPLYDMNENTLDLQHFSRLKTVSSENPFVLAQSLKSSKERA